MLLDVWNLNTSEHVCGPYVEMLLFDHRHVRTLLQYCSLDISQKQFSVPSHITTRDTWEGGEGFIVMYRGAC